MIVDVLGEYFQFRGVPLFEEQEKLVFMTEVPFESNGIIEVGSLLTVPKAQIIQMEAIYGLHMYEKFAILNILNEQQMKLLQQYLVRILSQHTDSVSVQTFLKQLDVKKCLVLSDFWEAEQLDYKGNCLQLPFEKGQLLVDVSKELERTLFLSYLTYLVELTEQSAKNNHEAFAQLKESFSKPSAPPKR